MKILVTGAAGFIGYHLSNKLISLGHEVVGLDNLNDYYDPSIKYNRISYLESSKFKFVEKDLYAISSLNENFDLVIHLAAQAGVRVMQKYKKYYSETNIEGFKDIISFCKSKKITKLIYASSSSVYGTSAQPPFKESEKSLKPLSEYGESKLLNEVYAEHNKFDLSIIGLRFFTVYGPLGRPDMAYYKFSKKLLNNEEITLFNNGSMYRDMTYIDDVINGLLLSVHHIFKNDTNTHEIFNLGRNNPIKTIDLLNKISQYLNIVPKINHQITKNEIKGTHASLDKASKLLNYNPSINIEDGLKIFIEWLKKYEKF
jgi:UDP-glucuronate 4-epimerase